MVHRFVTYAVVIVLSAAASGCSLPYEQLSLPRPVSQPLSGGNPLASPKSGTPLSDPASFSGDRNREYQGSGEFTRAEAMRSGENAPGTIGQSVAQNRQSTLTGSVTVPTSQSTADGITINLANASVQEAAKTVLGDVLGLNYVVSDKISAAITLRTVRPVDKAGLFAIFEAVLRAQDITLVSEGGFYKVLPSPDAAAGGAPLQARKSANGAMGVTTEILPLRYVAAAEMQRVLKSAAPQAGILLVDSSRNLLLLSGTQSELLSMRGLVDLFDVDWMRGMSFGIFPVETSDPDAIAQELDVIFANDKESPTKGLVRFVPNRRLKSILVITSRPEYIKKAETWVARIDQAARATEKGVFVYHVQNRPVTEVAQLLQKVYRSGGGPGQQADKGGGSLPGSLDAKGPALNASTPGIDTSSGGVGSFSMPAVAAPVAAGGPGANAATSQAPQGGDSAAVGSVQQGEQTPAANSAIGGGVPPDDRSSGIAVVADEPNNSLVITATPVEYKRVRRILETIDIAGNQVMIEATIAEVTLSDELKFGVRWFFQKNPSKFTFTEDLAASAASAMFPGFSYVFKSTNINTVVSALSTITDVNIVSSPTLMVVENKKAQLQVGDEVPIATQSAVATGVIGAPVVNSISYRNTGVILGVTPRVSDNGVVVLEIEQEVSDVVQTVLSKIDSPTIQQRRVKTTVNVQDGQSIILAGLIQDRAERERGQVPILGDLPLVGNAFKNKTDTVKRTELLIAITPQVIRDQAQISGVTAEYRDKLNLSTRPHRSGPSDVRETIDRLQR